MDETGVNFMERVAKVQADAENLKKSIESALISQQAAMALADMLLRKLNYSSNTNGSRQKRMSTEEIAFVNKRVRSEEENE